MNFKDIIYFGGSILRMHLQPSRSSQDEIREFLDWLVRERLRTLPYPVHLLKYARHWPYGYDRLIISQEAELQDRQIIPCSAGRFMMAIDNVGDIYPCAKWFYNQPLENCSRGDIERAWRELKPVPCQACLDLGFNLLNDTLRFRLSSLIRLANVFTKTSRSD